MPNFLNENDPKPQVAVLSDEQFAELKRLLEPGYEMATLMLADYKAHREAAQRAEQDRAARELAEKAAPAAVPEGQKSAPDAPADGTGQS